MSSSTEVSTPASSLPHYGAQLTPPRRIRVIGVPLDLGASRRGWTWGHRRARGRAGGAAGSAGHQVTDGGNIRVEIAETRRQAKKTRTI